AISEVYIASACCSTSSTPLRPASPSERFGGLGSSRCCDHELWLRLPTGRADPGVDCGRVAAVERSVILHTEIPTRAQVDRLLGDRDPTSVSIYLPTDPASAGDAERIEFWNLAVDAVGQLRNAGAERDRVVAIE